MTNDEKSTLISILNPPNVKEKIGARLEALEYLKTVPIQKEPKGTRTSNQNRAYWKWLTDISTQCENQGVTADMLFKHTAHIKVTKNVLHESIKSLLKALWGIESTTDLKKTGHYDEIIDHVTAWLGKENIEIPPFPSDEARQLENLTGYKNSAGQGTDGVEYPEMTEDTAGSAF